MNNKRGFTPLEIKIPKREKWETGRFLTGFTLIELLVMIAILALLLGIIMPALSVAREQGRRAVCGLNEKSTGLGLFLYANDYDGKLPLNEVDRWLFDVSYWTTDIILRTGAFDRHIFYCPSWRQRDNIIFWRYGEIFQPGRRRATLSPSRRMQQPAKTCIALWATSGSLIRSQAERTRP